MFGCPYIFGSKIRNQGVVPINNINVNVRLQQFIVDYLVISVINICNIQLCQVPLSNARDDWFLASRLLSTVKGFAMSSDPIPDNYLHVSESCCHHGIFPLIRSLLFGRALRPQGCFHLYFNGRSEVKHVWWMLLHLSPPPIFHLLSPIFCVVNFCCVSPWFVDIVNILKFHLIQPHFIF